MPAVATQQLAEVYDLVALGPPLASLASISDDIKNAQLRAASGEVLAAYGVRFGRKLGSSFTLATWGDFTKRLVVRLAIWELFAVSRGFNPESPDGKAIAAARDEAKRLLDEIADPTNTNPRFDPDATDSSPTYEEMGALTHSEGGPFDEADHYARVPGGRFANDLRFDDRNPFA